MRKRNRDELPEPCTDEAIDLGCTCSVPTAGAHDIDPPEPRIDKHCDLHGRYQDPDAAYDRKRDERNER